MQPSVTKKNRAISWDKKIAQPPRTKESRNLLRQKIKQLFKTKKNHVTSCDQKKQTNSWRKKNHATSLGRKKSRNLFRKKNHATSQDKKKITQPLGTKNGYMTSLGLFESFSL